MATINDAELANVPRYYEDYNLSRRLCNNIVEYYRDHPSYPRNFWQQIDCRVFRSANGKYYEVRSNLDQLLADIYSLEEKYNND